LKNEGPETHLPG